jgi:hypothetical protein
MKLGTIASAACGLFITLGLVAIHEGLQRKNQRARAHIEARRILEALGDDPHLAPHECENFRSRGESWLTLADEDSDLRHWAISYIVLCSHDAPMALVNLVLADVRRREPYACMQATWALANLEPTQRRREATTVAEVYQFCCKLVVDDSGGQNRRHCSALEP